MSRQAKNRNVMRSMCARLSSMMDFMQESDSEISRKLGYANPTTIARMRNGESFVDVERLALLGVMSIDQNVTPNLHWILTGDGEPVISVTDESYAKALGVIIRKKAEISLLVAIM